MSAFSLSAYSDQARTIGVDIGRDECDMKYERIDGTRNRARAHSGDKSR